MRKKFKLKSGNKPNFKEIGGNSPLNKKPSLGEFMERETSGGRFVPTMKEWGGVPATYDEYSGEYNEPYAWQYEKDYSPEGDFGYRQKYYQSEKNRLKNRRGGGLKSWETLGGKPVLGRTSTKGVTKTEGKYAVDAPGDAHVEKYLEGDKIAKSTRRKRGSLEIQRDKTKRKKKGFVRKTGEGFLGLQNRRKWIDGVEVTKK